MTHRRLLLVVVFLAIFSFDLARPTDIDFWWHLGTGEIIAHTGAVPGTDPFSYTAAGRPWIAHEWLWELGVFRIYACGGFALAVLASALLVTLTYAVLYRLLRRLGANEILAGALTLWAAVLALPNLGVRPRELTFLFVALFARYLLLYREGTVQRLWVLPIAMAVWVNVHGAFVLGIALLALVAAGETFAWWRVGGRSPRHLVVVGGLTLAAVALNPSGPRMLLYPFSYYFGDGNPSLRIVTEFQSPDFHEPMSLLFAAGLAAFMVFGVRRGRQAVPDAILVTAFTLSALVSTRQISVAALVLAPLLALRLCERFQLARELPPPRLPRGLTALNWIVLAALLAGGGIYAARADTWHRIQLAATPDAGLMPVAGARFIEEHELPGAVFNHQAWGGYLIHAWHPRRRVFIDGRIDMYGPDIVREYTAVVNIQPQWESVLEKYDVRTVLVPTQSPLSVLLSTHPRWDRLFEGPVEDVFVRRPALLPPKTPNLGPLGHEPSATIPRRYAQRTRHSDPRHHSAHRSSFAS